MPETVRRDKIQIDPELLKKLYEECEGWKQRIHEKLQEEEGIKVKYSTLTRILRNLGIGCAEDSRCDRVPDVPGKEMQHDTTVYTRSVGGKPTRVIASLLYLRYSKRRYLKFYRKFNRFTMKCFFHEALTHWGYAAPQCIIDNTNLARLRGTGSDAVMVPEMEAFSKQYGFKFLCHAKGHANRKAGEERSFWTVETNFFPGRTFQSLEDMNGQAFEWATVRMEHRPVAKTGLIPAKAFEHEEAHLKKLPPYLPAPYRVHKRDTDQYGNVSFDGNYYWVPGTDRGVKNERFSPEGFPKPPYKPKNRKKPTAEEEKRLRSVADVVGVYLDFALKPKGTERHRFVRALFGLSQRMSSALFIRTIERALKYQITDIETVRRIALLSMGEGIEPLLPCAEVDESFREREAYVEGHLSEEPDFSPYDELLEEDDG
jgi:hypothetical protein